MSVKKTALFLLDDYEKNYGYEKTDYRDFLTERFAYDYSVHASKIESLHTSYMGKYLLLKKITSDKRAKKELRKYYGRRNYYMIVPFLMVLSFMIKNTKSVLKGYN